MLHDGNLNHKEFVGRLSKAGCCKRKKRPRLDASDHIASAATPTTSSRKTEITRPSSPSINTAASAVAQKQQAGVKLAPIDAVRLSSPAASSATAVGRKTKTETVAVSTIPEAPKKHGKQLPDDQSEEQIETLTAVYRFIDTSNDGDISLKEFGLLRAIWSELWLSMHEFVTHLEKAFGTLDDAWQYADVDNNGTLDFAEFERVAGLVYFEGAIRYVFMFLDSDGDDDIGWNEWMQLHNIGTTLKKPYSELW